MKIKSLIILLATELMFSCSQSPNTTELKPDDDFGIGQKTEGEFIGEFSDRDPFGLYGVLIFKNGKGDSIPIFDVGQPETTPDQELIDSMYNSPKKFSRQLFKIKWKIYPASEDEQDGPGPGAPILLSVKRLSNAIDNNYENAVNIKTSEDIGIKQKSEIVELRSGEYFFNCDMNMKIKIKDNNTFSADWEECEIGGIINGNYDYDQNTKKLILNWKWDTGKKSEATFFYENNTLIPPKDNPFTACSFCEKEHYILK
jgi:hypothetical protein